jgi:hypothetical protein
MLVCKTCKSPVRVNQRGEAYHRLPGRLISLETQARETEEMDEQLAQTPGFSKQITSKDYMETTVEGF